jgi:cytoskeleton protein RodZ
MKNLGEYLRAERLARGITLEQISADTRITVSMLQAMEEGDIDRLPAPVFTKGFLRAYAEQVGLDPDEVVMEYQDLIGEVDAPQETMEKFHQRLRPEPSRKKLVALFLALPVIIGLAVFFWRTSHVVQEPPATTGEEPIEITQQSQGAEDGDVVSVSPPVQPATRSEQAAEISRAEIESRPITSEVDVPAPPVSSGDENVSIAQENGVLPEDDYQQQVEIQSPTAAAYVLTAMAKETTWLSVSIDGMQKREYTLRPGEQLTWSATTGYKLHIGNAAGLKLYLNDEPIKYLGRSGRVVRLKLPDPSLIDTSERRNVVTDQ